MIFLKTFLILIAVLVVSCPAHAQDAEVPAGEWRLVQIDGRRVVDSPMFIKLAGSGPVTGNAGCNQLFGTVTMGVRNLMTFSRIGTTRMACSDRELGRLESRFIRALRHIRLYKIVGNSLDLYSRYGRILRFTAVRKLPPVDPERSGLSGKWRLELIGPKRLHRMSDEPFINFDPIKKSGGGNTGCNVFGGSYTSTAAALNVFDVISTMRACIEDDRMALEQQFLDGLRRTDNYKINSDVLTLSEGRQLLLTFRRMD